MATKTFKTGSIQTLRVEECEHSGDIELALKDLNGYRLIKQSVCDGPEVGFIAVKVVNAKSFTASLAKADFLGFSGNGDVVSDRVAEEEGMHEYEYGDDEDEDGEW